MNKKDLKTGIKKEKKYLDQNMLLNLINSNTQKFHLVNKYLGQY